MYHNAYDKKDALAIPIEAGNFPNVDTLIDAFYAFTGYANIQEKAGD
ncbi:hypothetical protein [Aerococcus urinaehominis]